MGKKTKYKIIKVKDNATNEVSEILRQAIEAEYDAVRQYEQMINDIDKIGMENHTDYSAVLMCFQDIVDEEKRHVGEFNKLIEVVSPVEYKLYKEGEQEVIEEIKNN